MRLHKLKLSRFRGFSDFELQFSPNATVLVGTNGAGKTTILDAIALVMSYFLVGVRTGKADGPSIAAGDIQIGKPSARIEISATIEGNDTSWSVIETLPGYPRTETNCLNDLDAPIAATQLSVANGSPRLPLAVYFPTNRNALDIPDRIRAHQFGAFERVAGATRCDFSIAPHESVKPTS